jgi:hypothetical protein
MRAVPGPRGRLSAATDGTAPDRAGHGIAFFRSIFYMRRNMGEAAPSVNIFPTFAGEAG